jgi:hypothetical protein
MVLLFHAQPHGRFVLKVQSLLVRHLGTLELRVKKLPIDIIYPQHLRCFVSPLRHLRFVM